LRADVTVVQSAGGSEILDEAAKNYFRQWHEDPNCAREVSMSMSFPVSGEEAKEEKAFAWLAPAYKGTISGITPLTINFHADRKPFLL
jgi:hypothetical protein